jgi:nucleotide-binding universal stress UspA family protein
VRREGEVGMYKRILVPLDGTENDQAVLDHVGALAKATGASVHLLWLHRGVKSEDPFFRAVQMEEGSKGHLAKEKAGSYLPQAERGLRDRGVRVSSEFRTVYGPEAQEMVTYGEESGCDLIVLFNHGRSGLGRWFFSNLEEKVKRRAAVPVLLVPAQSHKEVSP